MSAESVPQRIAAVVLAAGFSRRLGRPKQLVEFCGEALLQRAIRTAQETGLSPVFVVTREAFVAARSLSAVTNEAPREVTFHADGEAALWLINADAEEGMASSIRLGVAAVQQHGCRGVVVMTCDQPGVTVSHLQQLCSVPERLTASRYAGRSGVPAYFPQSAFAALSELRGEVGARDLLRAAYAVEDEALALDIDNEVDVATLHASELRSSELRSSE
jgi:molybdenum cofactor cytidylyltransferase